VRRWALCPWAADVTGPSGFPALLATGGVSQNSLRSNSCEPWSARRCAARRCL